MKNKDPEELLRSYDCKVIGDDVFFELKYAVNAIQQYADQTKSEIIDKVIAEIDKWVYSTNTVTDLRELIKAI